MTCPEWGSVKVTRFSDKVGNIPGTFSRLHGDALNSRVGWVFAGNADYVPISVALEKQRQFTGITTIKIEKVDSHFPRRFTA